MTGGRWGFLEILKVSRLRIGFFPSRAWFQRGASTPPQTGTASDPTHARKDPWGCMAGTVTIMPGTDLTAPSGDERDAPKGSW